MDADEEIEQAVRTYGWQAISIFDQDPPFLYSIGLMPDHPEAIIFGLEPEISKSILDIVVGRSKQGEVFGHKGVYDITTHNGQIAVRNVHQTQIPLYLGYAMGYCRRIGCGELQAIQIFWPDKFGKFPFDANCDLEVYHCQPRLDIGLTPKEIAAWERLWE